MGLEEAGKLDEQAQEVLLEEPGEVSVVRRPVDGQVGFEEAGKLYEQEQDELADEPGEVTVVRRPEDGLTGSEEAERPDEEEKEELPDEPGEVTLAFLEEAEEERLLKRGHFPSKVGGRPVWLDPVEVPHADDVRCDKCQERMCFLAQVYCPWEEPAGAFHRYLYVFTCRTKYCNNAMVLRSQLPRVNKYYPTDYEADAPALSEAEINLCALCGLRATKRCSVSHTWYCGRSCQREDWRLGHKKVCSNPDSANAAASLSKGRTSWLFPEWELVMEPEPALEGPHDKQSVMVGGDQPADDEDPDELPEESFNVVDDELVDFQTRVAVAPEQVVRYHRDGRPLWPYAESKLMDEPLSCTLCGAPRRFELQILPQMLYYLRGDDYGVDFGTLAIFTCSMSCSISRCVPEFVHFQLPATT